MKRVLISIATILILALVFYVYIIYTLENIPVYFTAEKSNSPKAEGVRDEIIAHSEALTSLPQAAAQVAAVNNPSRNAAIQNQPLEMWRIAERENSYNNELQYYSSRNVSFEGERIIIRTKEEEMGDKNYTSGMIISKNTYLYGSFLFDIQISEGKGLFPAIWLLPEEDKPLPEVDIFEMVGSEPANFYCVVHYGTRSRPKKEYFCQQVPVKEEYQVGLIWKPDLLEWYIDGELVFQSDKGVPDEPMNLIINQAVGGNWPGDPDDETQFPAEFIIKSVDIKPLPGVSQ